MTLRCACTCNTCSGAIDDVGLDVCEQGIILGRRSNVTHPLLGDGGIGCPCGHDVGSDIHNFAADLRTVVVTPCSGNCEHAATLLREGKPVPTVTNPTLSLNGKATKEREQKRLAKEEGLLFKK